MPWWDFEMQHEESHTHKRVCVRVCFYASVPFSFSSSTCSSVQAESDVLSAYLEYSTVAPTNQTPPLHWRCLLITSRTLFPQRHWTGAAKNNNLDPSQSSSIWRGKKKVFAFFFWVFFFFRTWKFSGIFCGSRWIRGPRLLPLPRDCRLAAISWCKNKVSERAERERERMRSSSSHIILQTTMSNLAKNKKLLLLFCCTFPLYIFTECFLFSCDSLNQFHEDVGCDVWL